MKILDSNPGLINQTLSSLAQINTGLIKKFWMRNKMEQIVYRKSQEIIMRGYD